MASEQLLASNDVAFNSEFANWTSASLANPDNVTYFCENWFVTAPRGAQADFVLQPLDPKGRSGLRVLVRQPPEMVRVWHKLPARFLASGRSIARFKIRGESKNSAPPQLDTVALFRGSEMDRKFVKTLFGPMPLEQSWREMTVELEADHTLFDDVGFISFRFSGVGIIEFDYCRLENEKKGLEKAIGGRRWSIARRLAARVMTGFRDVDRSTVPPTAGVSAAASEDSNKQVQTKSHAASAPSQATSASLANGSRSTAPASVTGLGPLPSTPHPSRGGAAVSSDGVLPPSSKDKPPPSKTASTSGPRKTTLTGNSAALLRNSDFEQWSGDRLEHWKVNGTKGVTLTRGVPAPDKPFSTQGVTFCFKGVGLGRSVSLSQSFGGVRPGQAVDVVVVGSADLRTEIDVIVQQSRPDGSNDEVRARVILRPRWQFRTVRLRVPPNWSKTPIRLLAIISEEQPRSVHLALLAAGLPGQDPAPGFDIHELPATASNAVVNGTFDHWTGPLARLLTTRQVDIAEEWTVVGKSPSTGVEARLTEIVPRGLRDGRDYAPVLGIAVHGEFSGAYLRLQTALDVLQIVANPPRTLSFFGRTAHVANGAGAGHPRSLISEVFIAERRRIAPDSDEFDIKRLFTIRRNLRLGRIGERQSIALRPDHRDALAGKALEMLHDPTRSLLLVFECSVSIDVAIADVRLGNDASAELTRTTPPGAVALEDPNIAAQLSQLKGLGHWQSERALRASPWQAADVLSSEAKWVWPPTATTIDIVICVHNAVEETLDCLDSLGRCTTMPHTVTIVDDKSSELTREQLRRYVYGKPWMRLIENAQNLGYTRSANIGLSSSSAEWVVLLNSDTLVTAGWLEGMFEVVKSRANVVMVGPVSNAASWQSVPELHDVNGGWSANPLSEGWSVPQMAQLVEELSLRMFPEATLLNGFCTMMRRDVIEEVGFLDEAAFPMGYGEENDLCLRVRKAGYTLAIADHVYVYHVKSASFGKSRRATLSKQGTAQLHAKHPDVDMKQVQRELAELSPLIELRKRLRQRLALAGGPATPARPLQAGTADLVATWSGTKAATIESRAPG